MIPETLVFLGPSLARDQAATLLPGAVLLPPAAQGDIYRFLALPIRRIILIDGVFHGQPAIWHREILAALENGIEVVGAASMGALRASETAHFGMLGIGAIFAAYCNGRLTGDDEVALLHGDADHDWRPLSLPLVNIRATLRAARDRGILAHGRAQALLYAAQAMPFEERGWSAITAAAGIPAHHGFLSFAKYHGVDLKAQDAATCLAWAATHPPTPPHQRSDRVFQRDRYHQSTRDRQTGCLGRDGAVTPSATLLQQWREDGTWSALQASFINDWTCRTLLVGSEVEPADDAALAAFLADFTEYSPAPDSLERARRGVTQNGYRRAVAVRIQFARLLRETETKDHLETAADLAADLWRQPQPAVRRAFAAASLLANWAAGHGIQAPPQETEPFQQQTLALKQAWLEAGMDGETAANLHRQLAVGTWVLRKQPAYFGFIHPSVPSGILEECRLRGFPTGQRQPTHAPPLVLNQASHQASHQAGRQAPPQTLVSRQQQGATPFLFGDNPPMQTHSATQPLAHHSFQTGVPSGTQRVRTPAATLRLMRPHWARFGITRLADVTRLDLDFGVPTYCAVRPNGHVLQTANGKGLSHDAARASALMEAVELWHAEHPPDNLTFTSATELAAAGHTTIPWPEDGHHAKAGPNRRIHWVKADALHGPAQAWIPADRIWFMLPSFGRTTTNGLASGNHRHEAEIHAVYECLERDALAALDHAGTLHLANFPVLAPNSLPPGPLQDIVNRIQAQGCFPRLILAPTRARRITVWAVLVDPHPAARVSTINSGAGCHHHLDIALSRALTEAVQSRLSFVHGAREDIRHKPIGADQPQANPADSVINYFRDLRANCRYDEFSAQSQHFQTLAESRRNLVTALEADQLQAWSVRLTKPKLPIEVVKVVIPGLRLNRQLV